MCYFKKTYYHQSFCLSGQCIHDFFRCSRALVGGGAGHGQAQVSCDWWRAGHVTTVLTSDWCRPAASGGLTSASEADTIVTCDVFPIMNNVPMTKYHGA